MIIDSVSAAPSPYLRQSLDQASADETSLLAQKLSNVKTRSISPEEMKRIDETAQKFEASFISQMLGHMFEGIKTDPMFGGGQAEKIYKSMMIEEYGKSVAQAGGIGIADAVKAEIIRMQEGHIQQ